MTLVFAIVIFLLGGSPVFADSRSSCVDILVGQSDFIKSETERLKEESKYFRGVFSKLYKIHGSVVASEFQESLLEALPLQQRPDLNRFNKFIEDLYQLLKLQGVEGRLVKSKSGWHSYIQVYGNFQNYQQKSYLNRLSAQLRRKLGVSTIVDPLALFLLDAGALLQGQHLILSMDQVFFPNKPQATTIHEISHAYRNFLAKTNGYDPLGSAYMVPENPKKFPSSRIYLLGPTQSQYINTYTEGYGVDEVVSYFKESLQSYGLSLGDQHQKMLEAYGFAVQLWDLYSFLEKALKGVPGYTYETIVEPGTKPDQVELDIVVSVLENPYANRKSSFKFHYLISLPKKFLKSRKNIQKNLVLPAQEHVLAIAASIEKRMEIFVQSHQRFSRLRPGYHDFRGVESKLPERSDARTVIESGEFPAALEKFKQGSLEFENP